MEPTSAVSQFDDSTFVEAASDIFPASGGRYLLVMPGAKRVAVVSESLDHVTTVGSPGEGPGELAMPLRAVEVGHELFVWEVARVEVFDSSFAFARSFPILSGSRKPAVWGERFYVANSVDSTAISVLDLDGNVVDGFGARIHEGRLNARMLDSRMLDATSDGTIVAVYNAEPRIELYDADGDLRGQFEIGEVGPVDPLFDQVHERNATFESRGEAGYMSNMFGDMAIDGSTLYILCAGFKGKGDGTYVLVLDVRDGEVSPQGILRLMGPEHSSSLILSMAVRDGALVAYESGSGSLLTYSVSSQATGRR